MEDLKIEVRLQDIYEGWKGDSSYCPIANAFRRVVPEAQNIEVDGEFIRFDRPLYLGADYFISLRFVLPPVAADFVEAFDKGREVTPIQFTAAWVEPEPPDWD